MMIKWKVTLVSMGQLRILSMVLVDPVLDLVSVVSDQTLHWPSSSISQGTDRVSFDLLGQLPKHIYFCVVCLPDLHSLECVSQPASSFSARSALSTTFMLVEFAQSEDRFDHIR